MSSTSGISPLVQVQLLTRGLELPFPPLADRLLRAIAQGFARAWQHLLDEHADALLASSETTITMMMCARLNALIDEDRRWAQLVQKVTRGEETISFDGGSQESRPDLSLKLTERSPSFPLVVECKLIERGSQKSVGRYCSDGLSRFLEGRYAWAAREGFLLAYVRDGSTLDTALKPHLAKHRAKTPDPFATGQLPAPVAGMSLELGRSIHERGFRYPGRSPGEPGAITLWHLWLYGAKAPVDGSAEAGAG